MPQTKPKQSTPKPYFTSANITFQFIDPNKFLTIFHPFTCENATLSRVNIIKSQFIIHQKKLQIFC